MEFRRLQIVSDLMDVNGHNLFNRFQLNNQALLDYEIKTDFADRVAFVYDGVYGLSHEMSPASIQLVTKCRLIHRLDKSRPQLPMHFNGRINHMPGDLIHVFARFNHH